MKTRPRLSFWQIWNMSFGFLGIQFGFALQNANVSRIFQTLGGDVENLSLYWLAAPVTGLLVQPIIGHYSDKTWGRLGRRRPYFLFGAILATAALFIMPNSPVLWIAIGMLWIMDASINISMEPFRAFVGDMLPSNQRTQGFAMQSFFIGIGAIVASFLPWIMTNWLNIPNTATEGVIPPSVRFSFYIGGAIFLLAVLWTVITTKEYSPEELEEFDRAEKAEKAEKAGKEQVAPVEDNHKTLSRKSFRIGSILFLLGAFLSLILYALEVEEELYILAGGLVLFGLFEIIAGFIQRTKSSTKGLVEIVNDLNAMPKTMKQLAFVQFFSWFALFAMWIYTTPGVTSHVYDMKLNMQELGLLKEKLSFQDSDENSAKYAVVIDNLMAKTDLKDEKISVDINLVNYFLNDRIVKEKETARIFMDFLHRDLVPADKNAGEIEEKLSSYLNSGDEDKVLSFEVYDYFMQMVDYKGELLNEMGMGGEDIQLVHRLKYIEKQYNDGGDWVSFCFGIYNGFAAIFAFLLIILAKLTNRKITHMISLLIGGISFISIYFISNSTALLIPFVGIGLVWASILAMPYAILTGSLPSHKMGIYMGIFNFFIVIPQIVAASILGFFLKTLFDNHAIYALIIGGISLFIAAIMIMFVNDVDYKKEK